MLTDAELMVFEKAFRNPVKPDWVTPSPRLPSSHRKIKMRPPPSPEIAQKIAVAVAVVAAALSVSTDRILSTSKHARDAYARQVAMYVAREGLRFGLVSIGLYFHRDHSTVVYATQRVAERCAGSPEQRALIGRLIAEVQGK